MRALNGNVLFTFLDETSGRGGKFTKYTPGGIFIPTVSSEQKTARWGQVTHIGPDVSQVVVGDYIYIEPLMWSIGATLEDGTKLWRTTEEKIMFSTDDLELASKTALV